ncbi:MAG: VCBS repeat-containing protein [Proteobacteria bacterium]|nr:VCBS repeat-containing protein [Pseudomonadota bacterium]
MKKRVYLTALLGVLAFYGCSDDSSGSSNGSHAVSAGCTSGSQCASGVCLENGNCAALVGEGANCDSENVCKSGLICNDGKCEVDSSGLGNKPQCNEDSECGEGKICKNGRCKSASNPNECETDDECGLAEICVDGSCQIDTNTQNGECESDADCVDPQNPDSLNTTCMSNGSCGHYVNVGDYCDDIEAYCQDGYECLSICIEKLPENATCDENDLVHICNQDEGLMCTGSICRKPKYDVNAGELCNDSYLFCKEGLTCKNTKCIYLQAEDAECDESAHKICNTGMICKSGKCTPIGDACTKTSDCTGKDSFCCQSELCGAKGYCIPYDETVTHDESCRFKTKPGIFEAQIQCRWQPDDGVASGSKSLLTVPLVGPFGNKEGLANAIVIWSYNPTTVRIVHPETCKTLESIEYSLSPRWGDYPAAADLDGDGLMEIITISNYKPVVFKWDKAAQKHKLAWVGSHHTGSVFPVVFDLDNDGSPEVIVGMTVYDKNGKLLYGHSSSYGGNDSTIGYLYNTSDGLATLVLGSGVYKWKATKDGWDQIATLSGASPFSAFADFGTPGATANDFDYTKLDGIPEIVTGGSGKVSIYTLIPKADGKTFDAQQIMLVNLLSAIDTSSATSALGGPVTIGDYDNDGLPEIGIASSGYYGVYDPRCTGYKAGECADKNVLWERWSQDASSGVTGSTVFDFDGDGQVEAVYADECFTRVYDGKTGRVLFSSRHSSGTGHEAPVVADIDGDGSSEILMGSEGNMNCYSDDAYNSVGVDPIHEGIRCEEDADCPTGKNCNTSVGLCTCSTDDDCNTQYMNGVLITQYVCDKPIHPDVGQMVNTKGTGRTLQQKRGTRPVGWKDGDYKVCRATRKKQDIGINDLMIYRDRLDRWVSSRNLWNQHAYNIINIEDNGKVPTAAKWLMNWIAKRTDKIDGTEAFRPVYNTYRLNSQGEYGAGMAPDITGRFIAGSICGTKKDNEGNPVLGEDGKPIHIISGQLCNRGTKPVAQKLPATFFYYDETAPDHRGKAICTSYTIDKVDVGVCGQVGCEVSEDEFKELEGKKVLMVSNLDEYGYASTVECNTDNNTDTIVIDTCAAEIVIVN